MALAVGSGIAGFAVGGAPAAFAITNGAALAAVAIALLAPARQRFGWLAPLVCCSAIAALGATLLEGPGLSGVHRWLAIGPLRLHAGMILVPAMAAALPSLPATARLVVVTAGLIIAWLQPDLATSVALALAALATLPTAGAWQRLATIPIAAAGVAAAAVRPDPLQPVKFVETALADAWRAAPALATVMAAMLGLAIALAPWLVARGEATRTGGRAVTGTFAGYALASFAQPFPQPLIGYGASPILGMGFALAVLRFSR